MSTIAIGDIHGESQALKELLRQVVPVLGATDTLVFLGDYIDSYCVSDSWSFPEARTACVTHDLNLFFSEPRIYD